MRFCTGDFCVFHAAQFGSITVALRFGDEVDMLDTAFIESDRPVWIILADWRGDEKSAGQLHIYCNLRIDVQFTGKPLFILRVIDNVAVQATIGLHCV